jgi:hypothetical protein
MSRIVADLVNFTVLVQMLEQYSDTIIHESKLSGRTDIANRAMSVRDKCRWFIMHLRATLPRDEADAFIRALDDVDGLGAMELLQYAMDIKDTGRNALKEVIKQLATVKSGQPVDIDIKIHD